MVFNKSCRKWTKPVKRMEEPKKREHWKFCLFRFLFTRVQTEIRNVSANPIEWNEQVQGRRRRLFFSGWYWKHARSSAKRWQCTIRLLGISSAYLSWNHCVARLKSILSNSALWQRQILWRTTFTINRYYWNIWIIDTNWHPFLVAWSIASGVFWFVWAHFLNGILIIIGSDLLSKWHARNSEYVVTWLATRQRSTVLTQTFYSRTLKHYYIARAYKMQNRFGSDKPKFAKLTSQQK